jgi:hypothetical protein
MSEIFPSYSPTPELEEEAPKIEKVKKSPRNEKSIDKKLKGVSFVGISRE